MQAVILAAGSSSRFWPLSEEKHKSLFRIMGKPIIQWTVESLKDAGVKDIIIIQSPRKDVENELGNGSKFGVKIKYEIQKKAEGMGEAVMLVEKRIKGNFFVMNADNFDAKKIIPLLLKKQKETKSNMVLIGRKTDTPWIFGILNIRKDKVINIIEKPPRGKEPSDLMVVGIYYLPQNFFSYHKRVKKHMYSFEDAINLYAKEKEAKVIMTDMNIPAIKYPWDIFKFSRIMLAEKIKKSEISKKSDISPRATIKGKVIIKEGVKIYENAVISGPCYIGKNTIVGNNSIIRDYTNLEDDVLVGANAEVTRSNLQRGVNMHSGFIGDSAIDKESKLGAGVVSANIRIDRDEIKAVVKGEKINTGEKSLGIIMGENSFFGVNVSAMPGILIGSNCIIGPGSIIKENIDSNMVCYAEFKNVVKKNKKKQLK
ncbi:MAG: NDP-sugar synthase [Proteobacteria bacterium]|nr:NDP-sugar synthase [Pseudomonadota bacterium]